LITLYILLKFACGQTTTLSNTKLSFFTITVGPSHLYRRFVRLQN